MLSEGRVALRGDRVGDAISTLRAALDLADRTDNRQLELEIHDLMATALRQAGRYEEALEARERHFALHREIFNDAADLRLRTLQIAHGNETARHQMEITKLKTVELVTHFASEHVDPDAYHLEAFERLAALAEMRGGNTTRHTSAVGDLAAEIGHAIGEQPEWCERLRLAARLHDIGKVAVADSTLLKPGPLTVEEFNDVKQHTVLGRRLLSGVSTELFGSPPKLPGPTTSGGTARGIRTVCTAKPSRFPAGSSRSPTSTTRSPTAASTSANGTWSNRSASSHRAAARSSSRRSSPRSRT